MTRFALACLTLLAVAPALAAQTEADEYARSVLPTDTTRWRSVAASPETRVYYDVQSVGPSGTVVDVWVWHAFATERRPRRSAAYDRVLAQDQVYCVVRATAPLRVVRYLGRTSVGSFLYPSSVGPFGWAPGSVEEAIGERVCGALAAADATPEPRRP